MIRLDIKQEHCIGKKQNDLQSQCIRCHENILYARTGTIQEQYREKTNSMPQKTNSMNFKKHLSQMMKSHVPLRLESHVRTKHNANTRTVWFGHVGTKYGRYNTPSCSWNWFQIVRESLTGRQSEGVLGAGKSTLRPRDVLRGDLSTTCGIAPLRSTPRFCGNWHQFVRESLTSTDEKKSPAF